MNALSGSSSKAYSVQFGREYPLTYVLTRNVEGDSTCRDLNERMFMRLTYGVGVLRRGGLH